MPALPAIPTPALALRQATTTITAATTTITVATAADNTNTTQSTTLSGGAIAGIVIGSIAGFLLLIWIIRSCTNLGSPTPTEESGRPWYGGVRGVDESGRDTYYAAGTTRNSRRGRSRGRSCSCHSHHSHRHHHHGAGSRSRSRRVGVVEAAPPVAVVRESRSRSRGAYY